MKILLANQHLKHLGGSETFTYAIYEELKRRGHEVEVFTFERGAVSDRMDQKDFAKDLTIGYDLAIVMHNTILKETGIKAKKIICIVNSTFEKLEQPIPGADEYIAISEEVQEHLSKNGFESRVVRNGVDLERFVPLSYVKYEFLKVKGDQVIPTPPMCTGMSMIKTYPKELKVVLQISNKPQTKYIVKQACDRLGLDYIMVGLPQLSVWNVERMIWAADLVVSIGRGGYEAMACGRPVILFDVHGGDGLVKAENVEAMRWSNCSGRWRNQPCNEHTVMNTLLEAKNHYFNEGRQTDNIHLDEYRRIAKEHFDIKKAVDQLLS